jgi:hypothetical protein
MKVEIKRRKYMVVSCYVTLSRGAAKSL